MSEGHHHHHHDHDHDHSHAHHGHSHASVENSADRKKVWIVLSITLIFMVVEYVGGYLSNSLALMGDATHMLTDAAALTLTLVSFHISRLPASDSHTFGFQRAEILGAFLNGIFLIALALLLIWQAALRLGEPPETDAKMMIVISAMGFIVNLIGGMILLKGSKDNFALRGALLHIAGDLLGSLGAVVAGVLILWKGWVIADPIVSIGVAILILFSAIGFVKDASHVILEGVPSGIDLKQVRTALLGLSGVAAIHDMHVWSLTPGRVILTLHIVEKSPRNPQLLKEAKALLSSRFHVDHSTIQVESTDLKDACN